MTTSAGTDFILEHKGVSNSHDNGPSVGDWLWEMAIAVVISPVVAEPLRALAGERENELAVHLAAIVFAAVLSFVSIQLFKGWLVRVIEEGWQRFSTTNKAKDYRREAAARRELTRITLTLPQLMDRLRSDMRVLAPQFDKALALASSEGYELVKQLGTLEEKVGSALIQSFYGDHTSNARHGGVLLTMRGYLSFLERMLSDEHTSLICLNKTLPLTWFATISDDDDFLPGYTALACSCRERITRITLLQHQGELRSQFQAAKHRIESPDDDADRLTRWMISLALPVLSTGACDGAVIESHQTVSQFFKLDEDMTESLKEIADRVYGRRGDALHPGTISPGKEITRLLASSPEIRPKIAEYVEYISADDASMAAWSDCINRAFRVLMDESGSHWAVRSAAVHMIELDTLKGLVDRHSEIGVFSTSLGPMAFHAKGDLYAGVVIRVLPQAADIEAELRRLAVISIEHPTSVVGSFGR